jgi:hypothetical protein
MAELENLSPKIKSINMEMYKTEDIFKKRNADDMDIDRIQ